MTFLRAARAWLAGAILFFICAQSLCPQSTGGTSAESADTSTDEAEASMNRANVLFNQGVELYNGGDYVSAASRFSEAAEIYVRLGPDVKLHQERAFSWNALCHLYLGNLDEAIYGYGRALELAEELGEDQEIARIASSLGSACYASEEFETALEHFGRALSINEELGNTVFIIYDLNNSGNACEMLDRLDLAVQHYERALELMAEVSDPETIIHQAAGLAQVYEGLGWYQDERRAYEKALGYAQEMGDREYEAIMLGNLGLCCSRLSEYDLALDYYTRSLEILQALGDQEEISRLYGNMSVLYLDMGRFDTALRYIDEAYAISTRIGFREDIPRQLNIYGQVYEAWGRFDKAHESYKRSLQMLQESGRDHEAAALLNNLGAMYDAWGRYDTAAEYYEKAYWVYEEYDDYEGMAVALNNLGQIYRAWEEYGLAMEAYQQSLAIYEALGLRDGMAIALSNLGEVHRGRGEYDQAVDYYQRALEIDRQDGRENKVALRLNNIGLIHSARGDNGQAREYFHKALEVFEATDQARKAADVLANVGVSYYAEGDYSPAAEYLMRSIEKKEVLRQTAEGELRRDYLASQIAAYRWLVSSYVKAGLPALAFDAAELASAKYLLEQMGDRLEESGFGFSGVLTYQKTLSPSQAAVSFFNLDWHPPGRESSPLLVVDAVTVTMDGLFAVEIDKTEFLESISLDHRTVLEQTPKGLRGFAIKTAPAVEEEAEPLDFDSVVGAYRHLLSRSSLSGSEQSALDGLSRKLYDLLLAPLEKNLSGKTELLIIPEGVLAFVPFETLRLPDGRYLVEKYDIRYAQSLAVAEMVKKRSALRSRGTGKPTGAGPLLAFGGAVYDPRSYGSDMADPGGPPDEKQPADPQMQLSGEPQFDSQAHFQRFKEETLAALDRGMSTRSAYEAMGLAGWANLPGTLAEVQSIGRIVDNSTVFTGGDVQESFVKELSRTGELKGYRVLHFATHGIVVPEFPDLSAIVLSQAADDGEEDGYLTMKEISRLEVDADFVNLSACETGLGALYGGEGVVGLAQAFLVAGANGLSVSLWQVADQSTMEFMIGVYELTQEQGITYHKAMNEMKRRFIRHPRFAKPFFWAPFVYYGN